MYREPNLNNKVTRRRETPADTALTITVAADATQFHSVLWIDCGYSATPDSTGTVLVSLGGTTIWQMPITAAGPVSFHFPEGGLHSNDLTLNEQMLITISDPGAQTSYLNAGTM